MSDTTTAREQLLDVISFTECANGGTSPDSLLDAYRDEVIADLCYGDARDVLARHRDQVLTQAAATEESLRIRLWLIEQYVEQISSSSDPCAIGLDLLPYLDGPIHPTDRDAYRTATAPTTQES